jgi:hypothetical protein
MRYVRGRFSPRLGEEDVKYMLLQVSAMEIEEKTAEYEPECRFK